MCTCKSQTLKPHLAPVGSSDEIQIQLATLNSLHTWGVLFKNFHALSYFLLPWSTIFLCFIDETTRYRSVEWLSQSHTASGWVSWDPEPFFQALPQKSVFLGVGATLHFLQVLIAPTRLESLGSLRVGHDWATSLSLFTSCIGEGNGNPLQ